tara:strand:+ start:124707 stop:126404 length:1698 start_codon:yes stop_codon:yes gene_type:complete
MTDGITDDGSYASSAGSAATPLTDPQREAVAGVLVQLNQLVEDKPFEAAVNYAHGTSQPQVVDNLRIFCHHSMVERATSYSCCVGIPFSTPFYLTGLFSAMYNMVSAFGALAAPTSPIFWGTLLAVGAVGALFGFSSVLRKYLNFVLDFSGLPRVAKAGETWKSTFDVCWQMTSNGLGWAGVFRALGGLCFGVRSSYTSWSLFAAVPFNWIAIPLGISAFILFSINQIRASYASDRTLAGFGDAITAFMYAIANYVSQILVFVEDVARNGVTVQNILPAIAGALTQLPARFYQSYNVNLDNRHSKLMALQFEASILSDLVDAHKSNFVQDGSAASYTAAVEIAQSRYLNEDEPTQKQVGHDAKFKNGSPLDLNEPSEVVKRLNEILGEIKAALPSDFEVRVRDFIKGKFDKIAGGSPEVTTEQWYTTVSKLVAIIIATGFNAYFTGSSVYGQLAAFTSLNGGIKRVLVLLVGVSIAVIVSVFMILSFGMSLLWSFYGKTTAAELDARTEARITRQPEFQEASRLLESDPVTARVSMPAVPDSAMVGGLPPSMQMFYGNCFCDGGD